MNSLLKIAYIQEIKGQCQHALSAFSLVKESMRRYNVPGESPTRRSFYFDEVFRNIHSFLNHAANVSKLFKPSTGPKSAEKMDRVAFLSAEYSLGDDHAIHNRDLRNDLEHYDERLDEWSKKNHGAFFQEVIHEPGSKRATMDLSNIDVTTILRWYNPGNNKFTFMGKEYDLNGLHAAIIEIGVASESSLKKEWRNENGEVLSMSFILGGK